MVSELICYTAFKSSLSHIAFAHQYRLYIFYSSNSITFCLRLVTTIFSVWQDSNFDPFIVVLFITLQNWQILTRQLHFHKNSVHSSGYVKVYIKVVFYLLDGAYTRLWYGNRKIKLHFRRLLTQDCNRMKKRKIPVGQRPWEVKSWGQSDRVVKRRT